MMAPRSTIHDLLRWQVREKAGRAADPSAVVLDPQTVRAAVNAPAASTGLDPGKKSPGRKRGIATDVLGLLVAVVVMAASVHDNAIGAALLDRVGADNSSVSKAWVDAGFKNAVAAHGAALGIDVQVVARDPSVKGFAPVPKRWVVEQVYGTLMLHRRLVRDYETLPTRTWRRWRSPTMSIRSVSSDLSGAHEPLREGVRAGTARRDLRDCDPGVGEHRIEGVGEWSPPSTAQVVDDAAAARCTDFGGGHVAGQQRPVGLVTRVVTRVDGAFQSRVHGGEQVPQPVDPAGLLDYQFPAAPDQQPQFGVDLAGRLDDTQLVATQPDLIGDDLRVAWVGLAFPAAGRLPGSVDRQPGHVHQTQPGVEQHHLQPAGDPAEFIDRDHCRAVVGLGGADIVDERLDRR